MNDKVTIDLCENGPMIVNKALVVDGSSVEPGAALCRCGMSENKPYCDGSHTAAGFEDAGTVEGGTADVVPSDTLTIKLAKNGPVLCTGPLSIRSADGETHMPQAKPHYAVAVGPTENRSVMARTAKLVLRRTEALTLQTIEKFIEIEFISKSLHAQLFSIIYIMRMTDIALTI